MMDDTAAPTGLFVIILIIGVIVVVAMSSETLVAELETLVDSLESLELTDHAKTSHTEQVWNVETISQHISANKCVPHEYYCEAEDYDVVYCELEVGKSIGLVIGHTIRQIITGYAGTTEYWANRCP
jgi:hypothetical protein